MNAKSIGTARSDPLRLALLRRLQQFPRVPVTVTDLPGFAPKDIQDEIARSADEDLIEARILRDGAAGIAAAVALRLTARGSQWLRRNAS